MSSSLARTRERLDDYTLELQRHGMESVEREVRWLNELIESERAGRDLKGADSGKTDSQDTTSGAPGGLPRSREDDSRTGPSDDTAT